MWGLRSFEKNEVVLGSVVYPRFKSIKNIYKQPKPAKMSKTDTKKSAMKTTKQYEPKHNKNIPNPKT